MRPLVLIVESDPGTQRLLQALLARRGAEADVAADAETAARLLEHVGYSAAVVDLSAGEALLEEIVARDEALLPRTIALTTRVVERRPHRVPLLRKPFEVVELNAAIAQALGAAPASESTLERDFTRRSILAGAKAGVVARLQPRDERLEHVTSFGYTRETLADWFPLPADADLPICAAVRHSRPVFLPAGPDAVAAYPKLAKVWERHRSRALAAVPVQRSGRVVGVMGWSFGDSQPFDQHEQRMLSTIAETFADAVAPS